MSPLEFVEFWKPTISYSPNDLPSLIFPLLLLCCTWPNTSQRDHLPKGLILPSPLFYSHHLQDKCIPPLSIPYNKIPPAQKLWQVKIYSTQFRQNGLCTLTTSPSLASLVSSLSTKVNFTLSFLMLDSYFFFVSFWIPLHHSPQLAEP